MQNTRVVRMEIPKGRRILAVSDIHGHANDLSALLKKARFTQNDILFIVGDILEKGPDSLKTVRAVLSLAESGSVHVTMGNVDLWQMKLIDGENMESAADLFGHIQYVLGVKAWGSSFFLEMCRELGIEINNPGDVAHARPAVREAFERELVFMRNLPTVIETQRFIFVHGGIFTEDLDSMRGGNPFLLLKNDAYIEKVIEKGLFFSKYIVVGHWPAVLYGTQIQVANPVINRERRIISIDGGCGLKYDGQLNALIIPDVDSEDFSFAAYDPFPVKHARDAQAASRNSVYIRYIDGEVDVLAREEKRSYVRQLSSGYTLWMPNQFLYERNGQVKADDYTDYLLEVQPSDPLTLVMSTEFGHWVKRNGVSGWYHGKFCDEGDTE